MAQVAREILLRLGTEPATPEGDPERYADLYRVARRLRDTGHRAIGLSPVNPRSVVAIAAIQLGLALGDATGETVAYYDAAGQQAAITALPAGDLIGDVAVVALAPRLVALSPRHAPEPPGRRRAATERVLREAVARYTRVMVDLTGFEATGEQAWAYDLVDAVALVARAGVTREPELIARHGEIPPERDLGVLLVG